MTLNITQYAARLNSYGTEQKAGIIDHEKESIKSTFLYNPSYQLVNIEGTDQDVHIFQVSSLQSNPEINQMNSYPGETFTNGNYVLWKGTNWLILNDYANDDIQEKVEIRRCRVELKWKDGVDTISYWAVDKIQSESSHGESIKKSINQSEGDRRLYIQKNDDTLKLESGTRFIIGGNAYSIGLIENVDFDNVLTLYVRYDEVNKAEDDLIGDIANNETPDFSV
jgi:hypothetical protein